MNHQFRQISPLYLLAGLAFIVLLFAGLFFVAQGIFLILMYLTPVFLIATLLLDYKVLINYGKWLVQKFSQNALSGISWSLITLFGFPVVSAILCFRAWSSYQLKNTKTDDHEAQQGEYIDYEIVEEKEEIEYIDNPDSYRK
jgi:hypothetical protein